MYSRRCSFSSSLLMPAFLWANASSPFFEVFDEVSSSPMMMLGSHLWRWYNSTIEIKDIDGLYVEQETLLRFRRSVEHWLRCAKKGHTVAPSPTQSVTVGPHTEVTPGRSNLGPACRRQNTVPHVCSTEGEYARILCSISNKCCML